MTPIINHQMFEHKVRERAYFKYLAGEENAYKNWHEAIQEQLAVMRAQNKEPVWRD